MADPQHLELLRRGVAVWNGWRDEHPEIKPDLSHANLAATSLSDADLTGANLSEVDLSNASLAGRTLVRANLRGAHMVNTDLSGANLNRADLADAVLRGARFVASLVPFREDFSGDPPGVMHSLGAEVGYEGGSFSIQQTGQTYPRHALPDPFIVEGFRSSDASLNDANLERTDLRRAVIVGAALRHASFASARFGDTVIDAYIAHAAGLNAVEHSSRSYLGYRAVSRLPRPIPKTFLRGCGMSDWEISLLNLYDLDLTEHQLTDLLYEIHSSRVSAPVQYHSVFISYSHADKTFATRLYEELQRLGIRCWYDERNMLPGDDIYEQIDRAITLWDKMLLCCSRHSLTSWWVDNEIDTVFEKERQLMKKRGEKTLALIPLDLDGYLLGDEWASGKKRQVRSRLAADFRDWEQNDAKFQNQLKRVIAALSLDVSERERPPAPRL